MLSVGAVTHNATPLAYTSLLETVVKDTLGEHSECAC